MKETEFRSWMTAQGQSSTTQDTKIADTKRIEAHYGDLDEAYDNDALEGITSALLYTKADERAGRENPARFPISGDTYANLSHYRSTLSLYTDFRLATADTSVERESIDKRITLFDDAGTQHWPVQQINRVTGAKAFRIRGASNRTEDAIETGDILTVGRALFKEAGSVRVLRSSNGKIPYLGYGKQKLTSYQVTPEIAVALGIPEKGAVNDQPDYLDARTLERLKRRFLEKYPDFEPAGFAGVGTSFFSNEDAYKRSAQAKVAALLGDVSLSPISLGKQALEILARTDLLGWRTSSRLLTLKGEQREIFDNAAAEILRSAQSAELAVQTMVDEIWPHLEEGQKSRPYSESRNIATMLLALVRGDEAIGINTDPFGQSYKMLTGKTLFGGNCLTPAEYAEVLRFARALFDTINAWGWKPRDFWDVQSFLWVNRGKDIPEDNMPNMRITEVNHSMTNPTNLIMYGPPGTGKTFHTAREAVQLCDGSAPNDRVELKARYDALVEAGQIAFVTFHQSYAYEDFVEGLRPVTDAEESDESEVTGKSGAGFRLQARPGIFRDISSLAEQARSSTGLGKGYELGGRQFFKMSLGRAGSEDHIYDAAIDGNYVVLGWGGEVDWSGPQYEDYQAVFKKWNEIEPGTSGNSGNISQLWRFRSTMQIGDLVIVCYGNSRFRAIGEITGDYEFNPTGVQTFNHRRAVKWLLTLDESLPIETIYNGKLSQASCYLLKTQRVKQEALARLLPGGEKPADTRPDQFVLIIDEINRANISKVFGELITLIEEDKRLGETNALTVNLPYSGDPFGVPNNLHIVGTMNTADRSIALLDTALRRRFIFKELMPQPGVLQEAAERTGVNLIGLLRTLNERIEYLFDREHQVGHAYFMRCASIEDIHDVMRHRIIPLLAEYFYEDWNKVAMVLGDAEGAGRFITRTKLSPPSGMMSDGFDEDRYRWHVRETFEDTVYDIFA